MSNLIFPDGYRTGCLERATAFGTCCDKLSDRVNVITDPDVYAKLIGTVKLTNRIKVVLDQQRNGSCATESTTSGVHLIREANNQPFTLLNPLSIYWQTSGGSDRGSNIDKNLIYARDVGILPESVWPRSRGFKTKPPQDLLDNVACLHQIREFYDIDGIDERRTALILGFPVIFGWRSHSCVLIELLDMHTALYLNSWGAGWSDNPYGYPGVGVIKLKDINPAYGEFAVRTTTDAGIIVPDTSLVNVG